MLLEIASPYFWGMSNSCIFHMSANLVDDLHQLDLDLNCVDGRIRSCFDFQYILGQLKGDVS